MAKPPIPQPKPAAAPRKEEPDTSGRPTKGVMPHFGGKAAPLYTSKKR